MNFISVAHVSVFHKFCTYLGIKICNYNLIILQCNTLHYSLPSFQLSNVESVHIQNDLVEYS